MQGGASGSAPQFNASQATTDSEKANLGSASAQQAMNNVNQVTPYGSLNYNQTGSYVDPNTGMTVPTYTATQTLNPQEQANLTQSQAMQGTALTGAGQALSQYNPNLPSQQQFENNAYNDLMSRQNQQFQTQQQQLQTQLANQGIQAGTTAYNNAFLPLEQSQVDAVNQAQLQASNLAGQNLSQAESIQNQALNGFQSLFGTGSGMPSPGYVNTPNTTVSPTNAGAMDLAQYQGELNSYNQQLAANNATAGGLFGLGGSVLGGLAGNQSLFKGLFGLGGGSNGGFTAPWGTGGI